MKMPEVRDALRVIADKIETLHSDPVLAEELRDLANETIRRKHAAKPRVTSPPMTAEMKRRIWKLRQANPKMTQTEIANLLGINAGRVSETLHGFRE